MSAEPEQRRAARLIVRDSMGRVLLFRHARKSGRSFWAPPGGGVEAGETFEQAAAREAREELGVRDVRLHFLWEDTAEFVHVDRLVRQQERFFAIDGVVNIVDADVAQTHASEGILDARWWPLSELLRTAEPVFPERLADKLSGLT